MPSRTVGVFAVLVGLVWLTAVPRAGSDASKDKEKEKEDVVRQIRFGAEMARQGNWHEAIFRWQRVLPKDPTNPRLHNNLAVAWESLGEYDKADAEYKAALSAAKVPDEIRRNEELFRRFYALYKQREATLEGAAEAVDKDAPGAGGH